MNSQVHEAVTLNKAIQNTLLRALMVAAHWDPWSKKDALRFSVIQFKKGLLLLFLEFQNPEIILMSHAFLRECKQAQHAYAVLPQTDEDEADTKFFMESDAWVNAFIKLTEALGQSNAAKEVNWKELGEGNELAVPRVIENLKTSLAQIGEEYKQKAAIRA